MSSYCADGGVFQHIIITLAVVVVILHLSSIIILIIIYYKTKSRSQQQQTTTVEREMLNETIQFLVNIIPLLVVSLPLVLFDCYYFICSYISGSNLFNERNDQCNRWLAPYAGISILILSVLHPINSLRNNNHL